MNKESYKIIFGKNLKRYRSILHFTQELLAEKLGITAQHLSYLESGRRAPSFDVILSTSQIFKISSSDMLLESDPLVGQSKKKEIAARINQLLKNVETGDQEKILKIISLCLSLNR